MNGNRNNINDKINFGLRSSGEPKGLGFLGALQRPEGGVSTELSIGVGMDGKEILIPSLVPTLNQKEIDFLLKGGKPTQEIVDKAVQHARERMLKNLSPFAD